jgi:hypothetical protein
LHKPNAIMKAWMTVFITGACSKETTVSPIIAFSIA